MRHKEVLEIWRKYCAFVDAGGSFAPRKDKDIMGAVAGKSKTVPWGDNKQGYPGVTAAQAGRGLDSDSCSKVSGTSVMYSPTWGSETSLTSVASTEQLATQSSSWTVPSSQPSLFPGSPAGVGGSKEDERSDDTDATMSPRVRHEDAIRWKRKMSAGEELREKGR